MDVIDKLIKQNSDINKMLQISEEFLQYNEASIDYQKITDNLLSLCDGKYAVFNLFSPEGTTFTTKAISGNLNMIKKATELLGYNLIGKEWPYDPVYLKKISQRNTVHFSNLSDIVGDTIPKPIIILLDRIVKIGEVVVIKITVKEKIIGEFTVFMEKNVLFNEAYIAEIYTKQVGLLLAKFNLESKIKKEENFLKTTLLSISDGVIATDLKGNIGFINKAAEQLLGCDSNMVKGDNINSVFQTFDELTNKSYKNLVFQVIETGLICHGKLNTVLQCHDGRLCPIEQTASPIIDDVNGLIGTVLIFRDYSEKKKKEDVINYLNFHDQLTGLYNRRFYEEELMRLDTKRHLPLSIIIGDVNGLKLINDAFGHASGDNLIIKAAEVITKGIRSSDIPARLGGDEFIVLLPNTSGEQVNEVVDRINSLATQSTIESTTLSISFGYASKYHHKQNIHDVIKNAENLMYHNKLAEGSNIRQQTIQSIMTSLNKNIPMEKNHTKHVSELCVALGKELGFDTLQLEQIKLAGLFHDIGIIGIDQNILLKVGPITEDEWLEIMRHSEIGYRILSSLNEYSDIAEYVLHHHEKLDGVGYPQGLSGDKIPIQSRIISLADSYDAMTNPRNYSKVMTVDEAVEEIKKNAGSQFDPDISKLFVTKILKKKW